MSEIENEEYKEKDIVWAKTKGYPWWPSTISQISYKSLTTLGKTNKEKVYTIELIGEKNSAKVSSEKIEPFIKNYDKHANTKNSTLLKSIETAKKMCEKKTKKEKENEEQNNNNKDSKDNKESDNSPKFLQKKRNNDRVILDDDQNEEEKDVKIKNNEEQNNNKISTPKNNIKINININFTNNNQNTYNLNSVQTKDAMNQTNPNPNSNNLKSNTKTNIPKFNSINYSNLAANEKTTNKIKKEKIFNTSTDNNRDISISKEDEDKSIKSSKKEKKSENKDLDLKLGEKPEKENIEESLEENENEECEEDNEELILTNDIINESIQKILNCQVQISNISSQKTINKELTDLSEKFHELFDKNQNDNDNYEIYYLSKDLIPILLNLTYNKNTDIMSKSSEILSFLNEKIIKEIFNLSQKEKSDLIESLNNNKNKINKDEIYDNNNNIYNINSEEDEYKEGLNILELINKKATIKSGISDMHTIFSKRGRPKKISTNSELSSDVFSSKLNENFFNINTINEKNYYEEFIKILSIKDKTKMESDFKELIGDFFENIYDKNNSDLDIDIAKVRKNMCIKIYKVVKKIKPEVDRDLIKKMIIYFEYKIRNSNIDKIYSNKIKELFEIIKERLYVNDKNK